MKMNQDFADIDDRSAPLAHLPAEAPRGRAIASPMDMLAKAVAKGQSVEVIGQLMALAERWEAGQARKAFNAALAAAKAKLPRIIKSRHVSFGSKREGAAATDYWHEDLAQIADQIDPILAEFGLAYRFETKATPESAIEVTCVLFHELGHEARNSLPGPRDTSGNKNAHQAIASAVTYLSRYALKAALGLSAARDDDGRAASPSPLEIDASVAAWTKKLDAAKDAADLASIGEGIAGEPDAVRSALRGAYKAAQGRLGLGKRDAPTPEEIAASAKAGPVAADFTASEANALLGTARARLAECKTLADADALWDEIVEPVKDRLADADYAELLQGFQAAQYDLKMKEDRQ